MDKKNTRVIFMLSLAVIVAWSCSSTKAIAQTSEGTEKGMSAVKKSPVDSTKGKFVVYSYEGATDDHYIPSGYMGDYGDVKFDGNYDKNCHSSGGCEQFIYSAKKSQGKGWVGIYWLYPADNWGEQDTGYNLDGMTRLTFWARGEKGGEEIEKVFVGGIKGRYPDSTKVEMGPLILSDTWKKYTIDLKGEDLSSIIGGFGWATSADLNPQGCTFYLDDIEYEGGNSK